MVALEHNRSHPGVRCGLGRLAVIDTALEYTGKRVNVKVNCTL
jgi:hypothetical protein